MNLSLRVLYGKDYNIGTRIEYNRKADITNHLTFSWPSSKHITYFATINSRYVSYKNIYHTLHIILLSCIEKIEVMFCLEAQ